MPRADASADRRAEILAAAVRVLARDGIVETTTRKIAHEAGVNQATLAYYFANKDGLLLDVLREMMRLTREIALGAMPAGVELDVAIREGLAAFWRHVEEAPELQIMQYELTLYALRNPAAAWLAREQYAGYCAVVEALFTAASAASGQVCAISCAELARFVVGGLDGLILQFVSDRDLARARRDLSNLIGAVTALAEGTATPAQALPPSESEANRPGEWERMQTS